MGRTLGLILIAGGIGVGIIIGVLMGVYAREGSLTGGAATLGFLLGFLVLVLPQLGFGAYLFWKGGQEAAVAAQANRQRKLLNIVKSRGQVPISDLAIEMQASRDDVHDMVHELVGMGLYSGYVNWDEGVLYSREASQLRNLTRCEHCSGELQLAGKGVIRCPYCGTEYFLE
jgi:DNA-directed RNA polymerase subunit RPC12/RpoP